MAVIWTVEAKPINIPEKRVSVIATRNEDGNIKIYSILHAVVSTAQQKQALWDNIWSQHLVNIDYEEDESELCDELKIDGNENLESREE